MLDAPPLPHGDTLLYRPPIRPEVNTHVRTVRPSLLDLRFSGDPWIEARKDGTLRMCLGDYGLAGIRGTPLDLPSLNSMFHGMRHRRPRKRRL
jgi:hypothetical protein